MLWDTLYCCSVFTADSRRNTNVGSDEQKLLCFHFGQTMKQTYRSLYCNSDSLPRVWCDYFLATIISNVERCNCHTIERLLFHKQRRLGKQERIILVKDNFIFLNLSELNFILTDYFVLRHIYMRCYSYSIFNYYSGRITKPKYMNLVPNEM